MTGYESLLLVNERLANRPGPKYCEDILLQPYMAKLLCRRSVRSSCALDSWKSRRQSEPELRSGPPSLGDYPSCPSFAQAEFLPLVTESAMSAEGIRAAEPRTTLLSVTMTAIGSKLASVNCVRVHWGSTLSSHNRLPYLQKLPVDPMTTPHGSSSCGRMQNDKDKAHERPSQKRLITYLPFQDSGFSIPRTASICSSRKFYYEGQALNSFQSHRRWGGRCRSNSRAQTSCSEY